MNCPHDDATTNLFCGMCGRVKDRAVLESIRLAGCIGVRYTLNENVQRMWETGEPEPGR